MDVLQKLFRKHFGIPVESVHPLHGSLGASGRKIMRLSAQMPAGSAAGRRSRQANQTVTALGVLYDVREENVAFLEFSRHFRRHSLPVPEIYAEDLSHGAYLEQDLGDTTLFEFLSQHRSGPSIEAPVIEAYRKAVVLLPRFQVVAGRDLNYKVCYPRSSFDRQSIAWDLNYFKYYFLRPAGIPFNEQALEDDFRRLTRFLLKADRNYFLYRDFQSRNIMLYRGEPFFIDCQGGRKGALQYDIASLLYDSKADLPPHLRQQLLDLYLDRLADVLPNLRASAARSRIRAAFMHYYYGYVYVRIMQALGAYGFRGFYERKTHFLQSVPYALRNIRWLLSNVELPISLPTLTAAFQAMVAHEKLHGGVEKVGQLTVRISSFSFHRGLPADPTGHGGGFIFDARSLPNPGREDRFKSLTGKDPAVIEYLEREESVRQFLANTTALVESSIVNYQSRGFKNLMVSFGCTGGQHRSVYLAERLASHLRASSGVEVLVHHRELEKQPS